MASLDTALSRVVGGTTAPKLKAAYGVETVAELLAIYPRRLADLGELTDFAHLNVGDHATVVAEIVSTQTGSFRPRFGQRKPMFRTTVVVTDGHRQLSMTFFRKWETSELKGLTPGVVAWFSGKVELFKGTLQLGQPAYEAITDADTAADAPRWVPIYPETAKVTSRIMRIAIAKTLLPVLDPIPDPLPAEVLTTNRLMPYDAAIRAIHTPTSTPDQWYRARSRLAFDEAFILQTVLARRRANLASQHAVARPVRGDGLLAKFDAGLPFALTAGQLQTGAEIAADLARPHPMNRLLQGEVGSGKTVVALRAMLQVIDDGGQAALLAPTEVLAVQHFRSIQSMVGDLHIRLLTGAMSAPARRDALYAISQGAGLVVGTHALLEGGVRFADLGLVVVDEQHRFGVEQRASLTVRDVPPHVLVMTATPIPRTIAMTVFGDLDVSTLRDMPVGRLGVQTTVVPSADKPEWLTRAWQRVREEVAAGRQVYVVCPRIATDEPYQDDEEPDSTKRPPLAVTEVAAELEEGALAGLRIATMHGRLGSYEKDRVMTSFVAGEIDVLVATTVIEVGVDVANATLMVVLDADRFGLSQLHQLRGRVGRGNVGGLCLLVTEAAEESESRKRLDSVARTNDGFEVARLDLESRREGDVLGSVQAGRRSSLRLLSVVRDEKTIVAARESATALVESDPDLIGYPAIATAVAALLESDQAGYLEKT